MGATAPEITPSLDSVTTGSTSHQAPFHFDVCTLGPVTTPPQEASSHDVCKSALQQVASATTCSVSRRKGQTGLHLAAEKGSAATAAALMSMSANTLALDSVGRTPLHIAVEYCNEPVVAQLATHIEAINTKNLDGETALHLAVSLGHEQIVQILLAAAGCNMELKDGSGRTALHLAVLHGHEGILRKLVGNGANIDARIEM
jgi:ankyrin repeat protein